MIIEESTYSGFTNSNGKFCIVENDSINKSFYFHGGFQTNSYNGESAKAEKLLTMFRPWKLYRGNIMCGIANHRSYYGLFYSNLMRVTDTYEGEHAIDKGLLRCYLKNADYVLFKNKKVALIEALRIIKEVYKPGLEAMILHHISISYKDEDHYEDVMVIWDITDESWKKKA